MSNDFKEKLELYKQGKLNENASSEVEKELDKYLAVMDYLEEEERLDIPAVSLPNNHLKATRLKKELNFRYMLMTFLIIIALGFSAFVIYFSVGNIITKAYPDPNYYQSEGGTLQYRLSMYLTNLMPGYRVYGSGNKKELFAKYSTSIFLAKKLGRTLLDELQLSVTHSLGKPVQNQNYYADNKDLHSAFAWQNEFYLSSPSADYYSWYYDMKGFDILDSLPQGVKAEVELSFKQPIPISEVDNILGHSNKKSPAYSIIFSAIDTGFPPPPKVGSLDGNVINNKPVIGCELQSLIDIANLDKTPVESENVSQEWYNKNYVSLLKHMQETEVVIKTIFENATGFRGFDLELENRISYIEENGVNCIGVIVSGDAKEILKLRGNSLIYGSEVKNVAVW